VVNICGSGTRVFGQMMIVGTLTRLAAGDLGMVAGSYRELEGDRAAAIKAFAGSWERWR
jgi:hypothetical protein